MLHQLPEKGHEMPLAGTDLPHSADIDAINFTLADMAHHSLVAGAQQPAAVIVCTAADHIAAISLRLQSANLEAVHGSHIITGNSCVYPHAGGFLFFHQLTFLQKNKGGFRGSFS